MPSPVRGAFRNRRAAQDLLRKYESLANILSATSAPSTNQPDLFYRQMSLTIAALFQPDVIAVLVPDATRRSYHPLFTIPSDPGRRVARIISEEDTVVREFHQGKRFVCSSCSGTDRNPGPEISCCHFPLMIEGKLEAIMFMAARDLSEADREMISGFCRNAVLVLHNHTMERILSGRLHDAASLTGALHTFSRVQSEQELIRLILDTSADLVKAEQGSVILVDEEEQALLLKAKKGAAQGLAEETRINPGEGIVGRVTELGQPILVENVESDPRTKRKNRRNFRTRSFVSVPIRIQDRIIGVINLADKHDGSAFTDEDLKIIQSLATQAAVAIDRNMLQTKIEELKKLSATDQLTGLPNRRYGFERLKDELARSKRGGHELSILMLDLDGFKRCNDRLGHLFGDDVLIKTAKTLLLSVRSMDVVARYGGDEFLIILPETSKRVAAQIAERIRAAVDGLAIYPESADMGRRLSVSIGLASYPGQADTIEALLSNADTALYLAKKNGKNRVEIMR